MEEKRKYEVPKPKFQVGDYVRVLPRKKGQQNQYPSYVDDMLKYVEKICEIQEIVNGYYKLKNGKNYRWHEDWLQPVFIEPLFNGKVLVHSSIYDEIWKDDYRKYILGQWEADEPYCDYLPTKVVFNEKLKRTTLIFGNPNKPYDVVRSEAKNEYNEQIGFLIGMVKYLYKAEAKRHIDYGYKRYNKFKNNISNYLEQIIRQEIKLSDYQLEKLFDNITKKDNLKFNVNGKIHEIAIKRKEK